MEIESSVAEGIRLTETKAQYDAACKRLLSEKILLAWIMKTCLEEYQDCDVKEIADKYISGPPEISTIAVHPDQTNVPRIRGSNTEDKLLTEGTVLYDICFSATAPSSDEPIRLIINIEAQNNQKLVYALIKRGIFYGCRLISAQCGTEFKNAEYQNIKKVYSVWLCIDSAPNVKNTITKYKITEENIIGEIHEKKENYDLLSVIILRLGEAEDVEQKNILRLLNILFSKHNSAAEKKHLLEQDFHIPMSQTIERGLDYMCNLGQGIEDYGIAMGEKRGIAIGEERGIAIGEKRGEKRGIAIGEERGLEAAIQKLMQKMHISREEARAFLDLPAEKQ